MKKVFLVLILVLSVVMFSAPYNTKIRVLLWDEVLTQALKSAIPEFEKKTGIKVELDLLPSAQVFPKITTSVSLKSTDYDLVAVDEPFIPMLAPLLEPFTSWPQTKVYQRPNFSDFMPLAFEASRWNGIFMGVPVNANVYVWLTRKDLIEKYKDEFKKQYGYDLGIPDNLNQLLDMCKFFQTKGIYGWAPFTRAAEGATAEAIWVFESFGTSVIQKVGNTYKVTLDKKKAVQAINFYKELLKYAPPGALDFGHPERIAAFSQGKVFTMFLWPAQVPDIENPDKSLVAGNVLYSAPPAGPAKKAAVRGAWIVAIPAASKEKAAAAEFAYWWVSTEVSKSLIPKGLLPVRQSILLDKQVLKERPWFESLYRSLQVVVSRPRFEQYPEVSQVIRDNWLAGISGKVTPEKAIDDMITGIKAVLKKYGY